MGLKDCVNLEMTAENRNCCCLRDLPTVQYSLQCSTHQYLRDCYGCGTRLVIVRKSVYESATVKAITEHKNESLKQYEHQVIIKLAYTVVI
jgi:hypothetical protein